MLVYAQMSLNDEDYSMLHVRSLVKHDLNWES